ncbi:Homoserine O-acetyltransferase [Hypsizygus marmoreus]|uniref:Homoserine O-acetyltransferase n=1 Tax=Hypsizygus marmoreus TaxID=39966 RepID=A0A369K880_HYPMA|nr:Homoserine O-acetyltransferase [Hypsizygus marmoreus]
MSYANLRYTLFSTTYTLKRYMRVHLKPPQRPRFYQKDTYNARSFTAPPGDAIQCNRSLVTSSHNMASYLTPCIEQSIHTIPSFTLECGAELKNVPVAYKTWGAMNERRDNVMIICHAATGSADVEDWWGPLIGKGKAFDPNRFFIFCANVLGSPYGSASPITLDPDTGKPYGPEFPPTSIRDDVRIHKLVLDHLGVKSVAVVIGGSMGGMAVLEWPLCTPQGYVRYVIPVATSARHSAWCISWGEPQRQCIYSDPIYQDGFYTTQPASGLAAARMIALLTYRSRDSFERRFGRKPQLSPKHSPPTPSEQQSHSPADEALAFHNDGHRNAKPHPPSGSSPHESRYPNSNRHLIPKPPIFSAQSYLRYQGDKFVSRFDANCYIHITRKMDTHDVARRRTSSTEVESESLALARMLATLPPRALVISIASDGLFTPTEQRELAAHIPDAELVVIPSPEGHDGFLLEFEQINGHVLKFLKREIPDLYEKVADEGEAEVDNFNVKKTSVFGEAEVDITSW